MLFDSCTKLQIYACNINSKVELCGISNIHAKITKSRSWKESHSILSRCPESHLSHALHIHQPSPPLWEIPRGRSHGVYGWVPHPARAGAVSGGGDVHRGRRGQELPVAVPSSGGGRRGVEPGLHGCGDGRCSHGSHARRWDCRTGAGHRHLLQASVVAVHCPTLRSLSGRCPRRHLCFPRSHLPWSCGPSSLADLRYPLLAPGSVPHGAHQCQPEF
mmetsp:Transcript_37790/g.52479  ORF Transcript_37790/g.52479 Transcript_37790/m.52479 type:complete len:217 (+) Transcript_37790:61-711(+)